MKIPGTGKIIENFYVTGDDIAPVYLLDGPQPVLFDAGYSALAHSYEKGIKNILGRRSPSCLFLTHAHFDHVGAAAYLKSVWPDLKVACSERTEKILSRPGALQLIGRLNREVTRVLPSWGIQNLCEEPFKSFDIDIVLKPDQPIQIGQNDLVEALHTPGHTWDFLSYWVPSMNILIASEAVGCEDERGHIYTEFLVDYDAYRQSMERMSELDVRTLCLGHKLVLTGTDARDHIRRSLDQAARYADMVEGFLKDEAGDIERTVKRVKAAEWDLLPWPKQPETAYVLNTQARVRTLWQRMQQEGRR